MTPGVLGLLGVVFLAAVGLTRVLSAPTSRWALLDLPNERSLHAMPVPRTGGLAVFGSVFLGLALSLMLEWSGGVVSPGPAGWGGTGLWVLGITLVVGLLSFWDDQASLPVGLRLGVHAVAAGCVVWGAGLTVNVVAIPVLGDVSLGWLAPPLTMLFLVWMTNLYNFMDGMDGLAAGMTVLGYGVLGYMAWRAGHHVMMGISLLVAMAAGGFLLFNLPPARIFLGDVGSIPMGFLAGALAVMGVRDGVFDIWVPVLVFSPFVADATVTLFRRLLHGEKVWRAHREHYYQRLVLAGWSHRKTMLAEYLLMAVCGGTAVLYTQAEGPARASILVGWLLVYGALALGVRVVERHTRAWRAAG